MRRTPLSGRTPVLALLLATAVACSPGGAGRGHATAGTAPAARQIVVAAAEASWRLPAPVSRLVAVPDRGGVLLAGGLTAAGTSANGVYHLDPTAGTLRQIGSLIQPVHDAAGALVTGDPVIFGGGAAVATAAVQRFTGSGPTRIIGRLPQPRADLSAVSVAGRVYLLGGYTGSSEPAAVLATADAATFRTVAPLPLPVRYPAVAAAGRTIWAFGGENAGRPVTDIQRVDTDSGRVRIVGRLPTPLSGAAAVNVAGQILIAGGRTETGQPSDAVYAFDPAAGSVRPVAHLPVAVANAAAVVVGRTGYLLGGETSHPVADVQTLSVRNVRLPAPPPTTHPAAGDNRPTATPLSDANRLIGRFLIADRSNSRLLLVDPSKQIQWTFPNPRAPAPPGGFDFPDDAFFIHHGWGIIANQEAERDHHRKYASGPAGCCGPTATRKPRLRPATCTSPTPRLRRITGLAAHETCCRSH